MVFTSNTRARFSVQAEYEPSTLARILEIFNVKGVPCDSLMARMSQDGQQYIQLDTHDVADDTATNLANKMRQIVSVRSVRSEILVCLPKAS
ncbi:hypothetical protein [Gimibacter soli]|uniref:ACT domain-containing protein n=1 Tax=Gimibacter soli TaxID=3024400 RepID=A0AAE9XVP8_9PROT|nr:hypothetical protein [Gimibacter soli]WCL53874.1 hypothetical protein PH603_15155 [Gimibacter soli]